MLQRRIEIFAALPIDSLDRMSLQRELDTIGRFATNVKSRNEMTITIYHNPGCGTSRNVLALIRNSGRSRSSSNI